MERCNLPPRKNWRERVESQGMHFHTSGPETYWDESAYYSFSRREIEEIERATLALHRMCLEAVQHVIDRDRFEEFETPPAFIPMIKESWERDEVSIVGRFDLIYDGRRPPAMLEYNADTPTSLLEAGVVQWYWFQDQRGAMGSLAADQYNSIHERLIDAWKRAKQVSEVANGVLHIASVGLDQSVEDFITAEYLRDVAIQAGWDAHSISMSEIGWDREKRRFIDPSGANIDACFKLYPWEWMVREEFSQNLLLSPMRWYEPPWKMLLSNKALCVVLHELFPDSPYVLEAGYEPLSETYVRKPILSREGANVQVIHREKIMIETDGEYDACRSVYQEFRPAPNFEGNYVVVGSWMIDGSAAGIGLREDRTLITGNMSRFLPHVIGE